MSKYEGPMSIDERDHPALIQLLNACFREDGGDMLTDYPRHVGLCNRENIRVIKRKGEIASHVATSVRPAVLDGIPTKVAGIGAVATNAKDRGKGLASQLMQDAVERSVAQGADIMLISNDLNLYRRMGARVCGRFPVVVLTAHQLYSQRPLDIRPAAPEDIDDVIRVRQTMPTRYLLPREDLTALLRCGLVMDNRSDWWIARHEGDPVGFGTVYSNGVDVFLTDWAGRPCALTEAAHFWAGHYQAETFTHTAVERSAIPLAWRNSIKKEQHFYGSVLVIHARRFLERARPYMEERIGADELNRLGIEAGEQTLTFQYGGESASFDHGGEIAELFFGVPGRDVLAEKASRDGALYPALSRIFPMPLVWYGIGYV